eukprot:14834-Heterococcus_DN1.PRE.2
MSADSMRRYRSRPSSRRGRRSASVTARHGNCSSDRSAAATAAAAAQWSKAEMPLVTDSGTAAALAPATLAAAAPSQDYPMRVLEFVHVNGHSAAVAASTSAAEFKSNCAMHDANVVLQCHATDGNGGGYSNSYAPQQLIISYTVHAHYPTQHYTLQLQERIMAHLQAIGSCKVLGRCHWRCLLDVQFANSVDALQAFDDVEELKLVSCCSDRPIVALNKPLSACNGPYYDQQSIPVKAYTSNYTALQQKQMYTDGEYTNVVRPICDVPRDYISVAAAGSA